MSSSWTVIGNSGQPQTTSGHVPFYITGVACDAAGNIYTVHDWDEPGYKVDRWNPATGEVAWHSWGIINDLLDSIAVEPDGSYAYVAGWQNGTQPNFSLDIYKVNLSTGATAEFTVAGWQIHAVTGSSISHLPIALDGNNFWVSKSDANELAQYDKTTGNLLQTVSVPTPFALAIDSSGNIWVGSNQTSIQVYSPSGTLLDTPITGLNNACSISFSGNTLYIADRGDSRIHVYTISGVTATFSKTIGYPAVPGNSSPLAFGTLWAVAADSSGNLIVTESPGNGGGSRIVKLTPSGYLWTAYCTEFQGNIASSPTNPNILIGSYRNTYSVQPSGTIYWTGTGKTDYGAYFGNIQNATYGTPRVLTLGGNDFYYWPAAGAAGNLAIYRVVPGGSGYGPALQLASCLAQSSPGADGKIYKAQNTYLWSWDDTTGPGLPINANTVLGGPDLVVNQSPGSGPYWVWSIASEQVDDAGTIWLTTLYRQIQVNGTYQFDYQSIWAIPLHGLNAAGNPIYLWNDAVQVVTNDQLCNAMGVTPGNNAIGLSLANRSSQDGQLYVLAVNKSGVKGSWMSGNTLIAFPQTGVNPVGSPAWTINLTNYAVGLSCVPLSTGGFCIGQNLGAYGGGGVVQRYDKNGNLIASYSPPSSFGTGGVNTPIGAFDTYGPINCCLAPDGSLNIFAEDDFNGRVFRINLPN